MIKNVNFICRQSNNRNFIEYVFFKRNCFFSKIFCNHLSSQIYIPVCNFFFYKFFYLNIIISFFLFDDVKETGKEQLLRNQH